MPTYYYTKTDMYTAVVEATSQEEADKIVNEISNDDERVRFMRGWWEEDGVDEDEFDDEDFEDEFEEDEDEE
jgi:hypothetical protein